MGDQTAARDAQTEFEAVVMQLFCSTVAIIRLARKTVVPPPPVSKTKWSLQRCLAMCRKQAWRRLLHLRNDAALARVQPLGSARHLVHRKSREQGVIQSLRGACHHGRNSRDAAEGNAATRFPED